MKRIKVFFSNIDYKVFKSYFILSVTLILTIVGISRVRFTAAKYESEKMADIKPNFAFFITDVSSQSHSIKIDNIIPSDEPYIYTFTVSNFKDNKKSNVDLRYSMEIITTTNLPLDIKLYKNPILDNEAHHSDIITQNSDGVYFRHLLYNSESVMNYNSLRTDTYTLWISFPSSYKNDYEHLNGLMELIDIEIRAKQVTE